MRLIFQSFKVRRRLHRSIKRFVLPQKIRFGPVFPGPRNSHLAPFRGARQDYWPHTPHETQGHRAREAEAEAEQAQSPIYKRYKAIKSTKKSE